jgi:hypothetical protein
LFLFCFFLIFGLFLSVKRQGYTITRWQIKASRKCKKVMITIPSVGQYFVFLFSGQTLVCALGNNSLTNFSLELHVWIWKKILVFVNTL